MTAPREWQFARQTLRRIIDRLHRPEPPVSLSVTARPVEGNTTGGLQRYSFYSPELNLLSETGVTTGAPTVAYDYIWFGGQPVAQVESSTGAVSWYFNDHLGTPILQTDATGTVVWRAEYEPYGKVLQYRAGAAKHQPLRFPGQEYDPGDGEREYNIFRWYRAGWGRFSSVDPVAGSPAVSQSWNRFAYVTDRPSMRIDPRGEYLDVSDDTANDIDYFDTSDADTASYEGDRSTDSDKDTSGDEVAAQSKREGLQNGPIQAAKLAWKDFTNEFNDGGCVNVFVRATGDALNPFTPSLSTAAEPAAFSIAAFKYNAALRYAAARANFLGGTGLVYPMRSSVVRSMIADANAAAAAGPLMTLDLAIAQGFAVELHSIATGSCQ